MVDNILDSLSSLTSAMGSLKAMTEPKGISSSYKSITRDDDGLSPSLSYKEKNRLKESAIIIGNILKVGAFKEGPEAKRLGDLTPGANTQAIPTAIRDKVQPVKEGGGGLLSGLLGLLGLGSLGALYETAKKFLIEKFTKFVINPIKKVIKFAADRIWQGLKALGTRISKIVGGLVDRIKNSKFYKGLMSKVTAISASIKTLWDDALRGIKGFVDNLVKGITNLKEGALNLVKKIPGYNLIKKGIEKTAEATVRGATAVGGAAARGATAVGGAVQGIADDVIEGGRNKLKKGLIDFLGKSGRFVGGILKKAPIIGPLIEGLLAKSDIEGYKKEFGKGDITQEELQEKIGKRIITGLTGMAGAALVGALGTAVGGPVGAVVGAIGGDILGRYIGGILTSVINPDITRKIGSFFENEKLPFRNKNEGGEEMQDFLSRNGRVYKFNTRDDVLGMKTGGAIDNLMSGITKGLAKDNSIIRDASIAQVNKLDELVYLMTELLKKPSDFAVAPVGLGGMRSPTFSKSDSRSKYNNLTLI